MAALFLGATSVFAQNEQTNVPPPIAAFRPSQVTSLAQPTLTRDGMRMTRRRTPITGQPEGKLIDNMLASYGGYQRNWLYGLMDVSTDGGISKIVEADVPQTYDYSFDIRQAVNTSGELIVQDKSQLSVVVLLLDKATGRIVNANKVCCGQSTVDAVDRPASSNAGIHSVRYFNLQGRPAAQPRKGIFLKAETLTDGTVRTRRVKM